MRLVLTNDDGFGAPGIERLAAACSALGHEVVVCAPLHEQSGVGHAVSTPAPVRVEERDPGAAGLHEGSLHYAVEGSPADCARVALRSLVPGADWLLAGINRGANVGNDIFISGTVAAAREAAILGVPALAISQYVGRFRELDWQEAEARARGVLAPLLERPPAPGALWNVNLPHPVEATSACEVVECPVDPSPADVRFERVGDTLHWRGNYHDRPRRPGHDIDVCFGGRVAISHVLLAPERG